MFSLLTTMCLNSTGTASSIALVRVSERLNFRNKPDLFILGQSQMGVQVSLSFLFATASFVAFVGASSARVVHYLFHLNLS